MANNVIQIIDFINYVHIIIYDNIVIIVFK